MGTHIFGKVYATLLFYIYRYRYKILISEKEVELPWQSRSYNSTLLLQKAQVR